MKKIYKLLALIMILAGINACEYLEYDESTYFLEEEIFEDFGRTKQFLTGIYAYLPADFSPVDGAMRSSASDDAVHVWDNSDIYKFNNGAWSAIATLDNVYSRMYTGIRAANKFLMEIEGKDYEELKYNDDYWKVEQQLELFPYEARFLRAFFYFELVKRYASVPLVTEVLNAEEANNVGQSSFDDIAAFIANECDTVAKYLPVSYKEMANGETGRVTRGTAMALKARVLLYIASPLHNETGELQKWADAADAAAALIDSAYYVLEEDYSDVVNNAESVELIFGTRQGETNGFEKKNFPLGYEGGNTGTCPSQNLVDAYEMLSTGLPIDDPASNYDINFPYLDRDPRMEATILRNEDVFKGKTIETWYGGANAAPKPNATKTAYYLRKYIIESINLEPTNTTKKKHLWVLFRYAEVLLNYAESMNEIYGPDDAGGHNLSAREAANIVRSRAGMPEFPTGLGMEGFRERLRNERRVEFAFEDQRFWDVRRWKIGDSIKDIYGMQITGNVYGGYVFEKKLIEERLWEDRMNFYPIPQSELYINSNLTQNPGW